MKAILKLKELSNSPLDFFRYIAEDKSRYPTATEEGYVDKDNDFLVGDSGGFLLNINFIVVGIKVFSEVGEYFDKHGTYFHGNSDDPNYKTFWARETHRRRYGMTANCKLYFKDFDKYYDENTTDEERKKLLRPLRVTGDHYNFLNYGRIYRSLTEEEKRLYPTGVKTPKKKYGFPGFIDGQYWNFKVDEFIYNNRYHLCKSKARRKGYSYMRGSQGANSVNLNKSLTILLAAYDLAYLTDAGATSDMVKTNLDWYENNTYWKRGYLSEPLDHIELGYKKKSEGNKKFGFRSKVISVGCRGNESAAVGKDAFEIDFEEAGKFPNLAEVMNVTTSTTEDGNEFTGTIRIYGTGGTKNSNWEAFAKYFYNPSAFEMMPFENVWDINMRHTTCGFFHGQYWGYGSFVEDGNSLLIEAYNYDNERKLEYAKRNTETDIIIFNAQRANRPSEAFLNTRDNMFASTALNDWILRLLHDKDVQLWTDGEVIDVGEDEVVFKSNKLLKSEGVKIHNYIDDFPLRRNTDVTGCVRVFDMPYTINGIVPDNTYFITYDPVALNIDKKNLTVKHSLNSFKVWMYEDNKTPLTGKRIVASYAGRYETVEESDALVLRVSKLYNAKVLAEVNTGEIIKNFKTWRQLKRLIKDPTALVSKGKYSANAGYGMKMTEALKKEGLRKLREQLYKVQSYDNEGKPIYFLHYIYDVVYLIELQKFYIGGNFDRISDALLSEFEYDVHNIKTYNNNKNITKKRNTRLIDRLIYGN